MCFGPAKPDPPIRCGCWPLGILAEPDRFRSPCWQVVRRVALVSATRFVSRAPVRIAASLLTILRRTRTARDSSRGDCASFSVPAESFGPPVSSRAEPCRVFDGRTLAGVSVGVGLVFGSPGAIYRAPKCCRPEKELPCREVSPRMLRARLSSVSVSEQVSATRIRVCIGVLFCRVSEVLPRNLFAPIGELPEVEGSETLAVGY